MSKETQEIKHLEKVLDWHLISPDTRTGIKRAIRCLKKRMAKTQLVEENKRMLEVKEICPICNKKADGAMLVMGNAMAHSDCVIQELNKLLDPDWDGKGEPSKIVGIIYKARLDDKKLREKIRHEICGLCVHKPTSIEDGLFEDSPKTLKGMGCTFGYAEDSGQYCQIAIKCANKIIALMPDVEEAKKQEWSEGYECGKNFATINMPALIKEAEEQERERIFRELESSTFIDWDKDLFVEVDTRVWQALKEQK